MIINEEQFQGKRLDFQVMGTKEITLQKRSPEFSQQTWNI